MIKIEPQTKYWGIAMGYKTAEEHQAFLKELFDWGLQKKAKFIILFKEKDSFYHFHLQSIPLKTKSKLQLVLEIYKACQDEDVEILEVFEMQKKGLFKLF